MRAAYRSHLQYGGGVSGRNPPALLVRRRGGAMTGFAPESETTPKEPSNAVATTTGRPRAVYILCHAKDSAAVDAGACLSLVACSLLLHASQAVAVPCRVAP
jgi:hypothetical protein